MENPTSWAEAGRAGQPLDRRVAMPAPVHRSVGFRLWRVAPGMHLAACARHCARAWWTLHLRRGGVRTDGLRLDVSRGQARALLRWAGGG